MTPLLQPYMTDSVSDMVLTSAFGDTPGAPSVTLVKVRACSMADMSTWRGLQSKPIYNAACSDLCLYLRGTSSVGVVSHVLMV